jgi:hypothetical protein
MEPKVHCHIHRSPLVVPVYNQMNLFYTRPFFLSTLALSPSYVKVFQVVPFLQVFSTETLYTSLLSHVCYMPCPSYTPPVDNPNNKGKGKAIPVTGCGGP